MKTLFLFVMLCISSIVFAQEKYTFVFLNKKPDAEKLSEEQNKTIMEGHMANIGRLAKEGKLIAAGPFEGGGGIFVLKTTDIEEAKQWLSTDPGVQAKRWNIELLPFEPRYNSVCAVGENYEMVMYTFFRFDAVVSKFSASTYPTIIKKHEDFLKEIIKTGNVVSEGIFGAHDGGILIMKGEVGKNMFDTDPGVTEALISVDMKKLYIAKGSFCEK